MSTTELILAIAAVVLPVLTYFAGVERGKLLQKIQKRTGRIDQVVEKYISGIREHRIGSLLGLLRAGVANLEDDAEIREACKTIALHGETSPIRNYPVLFASVDLKGFFVHASKLSQGHRSDTNIFGIFPPEKIIEEITKKKKGDRE